MSFDLDEWSAEIGASMSGESAIDAMTSEADRIRTHIESRRGMMQRQIASDDIKSKLCDKIQGLKRAVPGLAARIYAIEDDDPELFKYIRNLEFINQGIWCPRCNIQKNIGGRPESNDTVPAPDSKSTAEIEAEQSKLQSELDQLVITINLLQRKFNAAISELATNANDIADRINHLGKTVKPIDELPTVAEVPTHVQSINDTVKKEDLPSKPELVWSVDAVPVMTSDDLLG